LLRNANQNDSDGYSQFDIRGINIYGQSIGPNLTYYTTPDEVAIEDWGNDPSALQHSKDWILLAGALSATNGACEPNTPDLYAKLKELRPGEQPWAIVDLLPSRSCSWCRSTCVPAERDHQGK
jgi:hypothetical protein